MYKVLIAIFLISICFGACNRTSKEIITIPEQENKVEEPIIKKEQAKAIAHENFETFYKHFHEDSIFQIGRIKFPVGRYYTNDMGESIDWDKSNWLMHRATVQSVDTSIYKIEVQKTSTSLTETLQIEGSGFKTERKFKRIQGKWFLIFYSDDNY